MDAQRYIKQINLKGFGVKAQQKLFASKVLVVGAGGLGVPVLQYLNAMGVGTIGIADQDIVEKGNLHRQVLYTDADVGRPKIKIAGQKLSEQNSDTEIILFDTYVVRDNVLEIISEFDVIVDATDNFPTRYLLNDACVLQNKPLVYGALHGFEGQLSVFNYKGGPTYRCLYPTMPSANQIPDCNENGVLGVIPGIIGSMQALEVIKILTQSNEVMSGKLLVINLLDMKMIRVQLKAESENLSLKTLADNYELPLCNPAQNMDYNQLTEAMEKSPGLQLIDVRPADEYEQDHLHHARNIPLDVLEQRFDEIDISIPVCFVCQSGVRSQNALNLAMRYLPDIKAYNLTGGMDAIKVRGV